MTNQEIKQEVLLDFDGENAPESNFERILIAEDSYNGKIKGIEKVELPNFNDKTKKETKLKVIIDIEGKELAHFLAPKIMKASTTSKKKYSNSKLYDLLVDLKLKDKAKEIKDQLTTIDGLQLFLSQELIEKTVRVQVKTSKANTEEAYSTIGKILRFVEGGN
jgi:hypothetical protein